MTRCVSSVSSVLRCVWCSLGLVSVVFCFVLYFNLARWCYCCLLSRSACLLISSFFWDFFFFFFGYTFFCFCNIKFQHTSPHPHLLPLRFSLALTHTPTHTTTSYNVTSRPVNPCLCFVVRASLVADCGSCFLAVAESQWASKERWQ